MMRKFAAIFPCVALILMMSNKAHADAASGTFDMSGYVTITPSATVDVTPIPTTGYAGAFHMAAGFHRARPAYVPA